MLSKRLKILLFLMLLGCQKKKAAEVTDFAGLYSISSRFDEKSSSLLVTISLDEKIHAYADGEKIGIPLKLEVNSKNGWKPDGNAELPKGQKKNLKALGESVVLEGDIQIRQRLKKGHGLGEASLHLQVCSPNSCDMPRVHALSFE